MKPDEEPKEELQRIIRESGRKSREIVNRFRDYVQWGQYMTDLSDASNKVVEYMSASGINWNRTIESWRYANKQQDYMLNKMDEMPVSPLTSSGSTAAYAMDYFANPDYIISFVADDKQEEARNASIQLSQVIDRFADKEKVLILLKRHGLSSSTQGQKSPVELFETAWAAFEKPVKQDASADTSLIPMRECINSTIAEMLRRRPGQEPAKSQRDKIISICKQLAGEDVSKWAIENMTAQWENLLDELSGSKQKTYSREKWRDCLRRASLFLMEFLESLDPSKMK